MATKSHNQQSYHGNNARRAHTEMPGHVEAYDINNLPDQDDDNQNNQGGLPVDEDVDDINFQNYKGIYANDDSGQKYQCPETGAHFEFKDLCRRMNKILDTRLKDWEKYYGKENQQTQVTQQQYQQQQQLLMLQQQQQQQIYLQQQQQQQQVLSQSNNAYQNNQHSNNMQASNNEIFSSSLMSEKLDRNHIMNMQPGNQKIIQFKNKFEELAQQQRPGSKGMISQSKMQDKPLSGNSRNNKENQYSFLQQKSMKNLQDATQNLMLQSTGSIAGHHNKRQSHDRPKQSSNGQGSQNLNAVDTYNKLMQIMNEKVLKNVSSALTGSRGKSTEKGTMLTAKSLNQPAIINNSSSNKKLKTFATNANISNSNQIHQAYLSNNGNSQSRDKSSHHQTITTVLKSQNKINAGSSRNANSGIQGQMNTQNATKQFMSFYSNMNNQSQGIAAHSTNKRMTEIFQQNQSASLNMMRESSTKKLSSQKSTGSIQYSKNNTQKTTQQLNPDGSSINDIMNKYMKQNQGISNGQTIDHHTQKSRNSNVISASKTVSESMQKGASHSKTSSSRPITSSIYGQQVQVPTSHAHQTKNLQGSSNNNNNMKRKSGSGMDIVNSQQQNSNLHHQSRNSNQFQQFQHQTVQNQMIHGDDYLKRVEYQNASIEGYTSTALTDLQRKIESKNKSRTGTAGVGVTQNSYYAKQLQNMSGNRHAHQQRSSTNMNNYFSNGQRQ